MVDFRAEFLFCTLFEPDLSAYVSNPRVSLILAMLADDNRVGKAFFFARSQHCPPVAGPSKKVSMPLTSGGPRPVPRPDFHCCSRYPPAFAGGCAAGAQRGGFFTMPRLP
jgi:hypothetical protein